MANGDNMQTGDPGGDPGAGPGPGEMPTPGQVPGGPPQGPPGAGGGPVLAALARRQLRPNVSAPGPGNMGDALSMVSMAVDMLQKALPSLPSGSPQHRDVLKAVTSLSRHMSQGQPTAGQQQTHIGDLLRQTMRNAILQKVMSQKGPAQPGQPTGGGPTMGAPQPPMPSTPLPGA